MYEGKLTRTRKIFVTHRKCEFLQNRKAPQTPDQIGKCVIAYFNWIIRI